MNEKKNILKRFFFVLIIIIFPFIGKSQTPSTVIENKVNTELEKRDISEDEVRVKLIERGYNPDDIKPEELPAYQSVLEEIVTEIENERNTKQTLSESENIPTESDVNQDMSETVKIDDRGFSDSEIESDKNIKSSIDTLPTQKSNIYGHQVFENNEFELFRTVSDFTPPDNYILSSGDVVKISIFGMSQADFEYTIDAAGDISATNVGKIYLKGLSVAEAKEKVRKRFSQAYRFLPEQFSLTLKTARTVTINIFGEVPKPGSYTISALNTGINALMAAGGVNNNGTVRNIKLIKSDGSSHTIDIYNYLSNPKGGYDYSLDNQDILYVPLSENIVSITGGVKRPMNYELLKDEKLIDLIEYAGGFTNTANKKLITVISSTQGGRVVKDVKNIVDYKLYTGDEVVVKKGRESELKSVKVLGEVIYPGDYEHTDNMTLKSVIDKALFTEVTRQDIVFVFRYNINGRISLEKYDLTETDPSSIYLNARDQVKFLSIREFTDEAKSISISGAIRNEIEYSFDPTDRIRVSDLILLAGGLKPNANPNAILRRQNPNNTGELEYVELNVFDAISAPGTDSDEILSEGDELIIYSNERYNNIGTVSIIGQVRNPDTVKYDQSLDLKGLILYAGGLKENANKIGIIRRVALDNSVEVQYIRVDLNEVISGESKVELQRGDEVRIYDKSTYMEKYNVKIFGEVKDPGTYDYSEDLTIEDLVLMSGGLTIQAATNNVEIYRVDFSENNPTQILVKEVQLNRSGNLVNDTGDIRLEPFDIIVIRPVPDFELQEIVYVTGEIRYPGPYIIGKKNEKLSDIVRRAGGLQYDAFPEGATLLRKRGKKTGNILINLDDVVHRGNKHEDIVLRAGDILYIPKREDIVSIRTKATKASREYTDSLLVDGSVQMTYQGNKSAKWYIDNFAGGLEKNADKKTIRVIGADGRIEGTRKVLFWYDYPTVRKGSTIALDFKPPKTPEEKKERKPIDWTKTITDTMAIISSAVTIIVLARQI